MNPLFVTLATMLCIAALAFILLPLWRDPRNSGDRQSRHALNIAVYRDRRAELAHDLEQGTLDQDQYDTSLADLEQELLDSGALDPEEGGASASGRALSIGLVVATIVAVPSLAVVLYGNVGAGEQAFSHGDGQYTQASQGKEDSTGSQAAGMMNAPHDTAEVEEMATHLRARLDANPDDRQGWILLGRTLSFLEQYQQAGEAFGEAVRRGGDNDPDLLIHYADILTEVSGPGQERPRELLTRALEMEPDHPKGLWLAGSLAYYDADYSTARAYWERLMVVLPPGSENAAMIRRNLQELDALSRDD